MAGRHGGRVTRGEHFGSEGRHRKPDQPGDTTTSTGEPRSAPRKPRAKPVRKTPVEILMPDHPAYRRARVANERTREMPAARPSSAPRPSSEARRQRRAEVATGEAREYARRAAIRATSGAKPSTTGRAVSGAAAGAATGAALGSVVPGIGTAIGAGAGAVLGGAGGAVSGSRAKKNYRAAMRADSAGPRKLLLAEFAVCATVTALSPLTDAKRTEKPGDWMKRMTAVLGLFFVLALISAAGRGSAKVAAGLGGLVTVVLLISERDLFVKLAEIFTAPSRPGHNSKSVGTSSMSIEPDFKPAGG